MSQLQIPKATSARPIARSNRRATIRYRCAPATIGKVVSQDDHEMQRAWIIDLSLQGIGMQVPKALVAGGMVIILIRSNDNGRVFELRAKVMHCKALPQGEFFAGCELSTPLSADELEQLL